jgi:hypothetical protein
LQQKVTDIPIIIGHLLRIGVITDRQAITLLSFFVNQEQHSFRERYPIIKVPSIIVIEIAMQQRKQLFKTPNAEHFGQQFFLTLLPKIINSVTQ